VAGDALFGFLIRQGLATPEQVADAQAEASRLSRPALQLLVERGVISRGDAAKAAAAAFGHEFIELAEVTIDPSAAALLPPDTARNYGVLPLRIEDGRIVVAVPLTQLANLEMREDVERLTRRPATLVVASRDDIILKINDMYRAEGELTNLARTLVAEEDDASNPENLDSLTEVMDETPIVRYVNLLIQQAINDRASDIHVEPAEHDVRVRYRIDGVLKEMPPAPKAMQSGIISRLKVMSDMDIAERRRPQDGRLSVTFQGRAVDLRVASLPTVWGEKLVMRILDNSTAQLSLDQLGFSPYNKERFEVAYTKPYGMILVTGPTGSGKSTTLYATLNAVNRPEVNIITVEDPVEYRLAGVNQMQTNVKAGMTFAAALRTILRADPDIVLIGEVRDAETSTIAIEAALTGHLVLTTLHTNDAPSAITRLTEMGVEPFLVASAVECVLAQRLTRRLCDKCKEPYTPEAEHLVSLRFPWDPTQPLPTLFRGVGCQYCAGTGFKGRTALHEVMIMSEEIERLAVNHASSEEVARVARDQGMHTLRQDGWIKVLQGTTTIQEILRVVA
jgi:type IV pilus assembly protein PilB